MNNVFRTFRPPVFTPLGGSVGLLEKRLAAYSAVVFTSVTSEIGDFNHYADDEMYVEDLTTPHVNHGSDPGGSTINLADITSSVWDRFRAHPDAITFNDYAHASLDGYHPATGGNGDPDLSKHDVTAGEAVAIGQPVYVSGNNTVLLADASASGTAHVIGLILTGASANETATILTEGSVDQNDWTTVIGSANLTAGAIYYLSTTAGQLTTTPPSGDGDVVVRVGVAITTTKIDIEVNEVVLL